MKTILLEDFLDNGIIKEKSFREKISIMDFNDFDKEKEKQDKKLLQEDK